MADKKTKEKASKENSSDKKESSKKDSSKIILYVVIGIVVIMLCCVFSGILAWLAFTRGTVEILESVEEDIVNSSADVEEDEEDSEDLDDTDSDNGSSDDSQNYYGEDDDAENEEDAVEEWKVKRFRLDVPLTESEYVYIADIPVLADYLEQESTFVVYGDDPYFSLSVFTVPEAYGTPFESVEYLFDSTEFGEVYRVTTEYSEQHYYSSDVTSSGTCNILGETVDAPCGELIF